MTTVADVALLTPCPYCGQPPRSWCRTTTGRLYLVRVARLVRSRYGPARLNQLPGKPFDNRYVLDTTVLADTYPVDGNDVVHPLAWNRR